MFALILFDRPAAIQRPVYFVYFTNHIAQGDGPEISAVIAVVTVVADNENMILRNFIWLSFHADLIHGGILDVLEGWMPDFLPVDIKNFILDLDCLTRKRHNTLNVGDVRFLR